MKKNLPAPIKVENKKNRTRQPIVIPSTCWCLEADKKTKQRELPFQNCQPRKPKETENRHQKTSRKLVLFSLSQIPANSCRHKYIYNRKFSSRKLQTPAFERSIDRSSERARATKARKHNRRKTRCAKKKTTTTTTTTTKRRRRRRRRHIPLHSWSGNCTEWKDFFWRFRCESSAIL